MTGYSAILDKVELQSCMKLYVFGNRHICRPTVHFVLKINRPGLTGVIKV